MKPDDRAAADSYQLQIILLENIHEQAVGAVQKDCTPPVPKLESRVPSLWQRASAAELPLPPAITSLPSCCCSNFSGLNVGVRIAMPPVPKLASKLPSG